MKDIRVSNIKETSKIHLIDYEEVDIDELDDAMKSFGLQYPSPDFAPFKGLFAYTDEVNLNGCMFADEDVTEDTLKTLRGKSVNFDHQSKQICGFWLGAKRIGKDIEAIGVFFKSALKDEYEILKQMIADNNLKISMEAWGSKEQRDQNSYYLRNINFAGGALLRTTKPAFPRAHVMEMAQVLEFASVNEFSDYITQKDTHNQKVVAKAINVFKEVFQMDELIATLKEGASEATVTVLDQISLAFTKSEAELASSKAELATLTDLVAQLKSESAEAASKIEAMEAEAAAKITKAREEAFTIAQVKAELAEFAEGMSEADLLNADKVEIARLKKTLASKEKEVASAKEIASQKPVDLVVASAGAQATVKDAAVEFGNSVRAKAYK